MRIGFGYDIHKTEEGSGIKLGGIDIECNYSFKAHSDGDVLIHAIIDGILGALSKGDLGTFFPPDDDRWKDSSSEELLEIVLEKFSRKIRKFVNIDLIIKIEKPRIKPYQEEIKDNVGKLLHIGSKNINLKVKSGEGVGMVGEGLAVEAFAAILLEEDNEE